MPVRALIALLLVLVAGAADAAVLIEARSRGEPLRLVVDWQGGRVRVERPGEAHLVDLAAGFVYELGATPTRTSAFLRPGYQEPPPWRLETFGPGPIRAGHASIYHVLFLGEQVCAEILANPWMIPFTDPGVQALALLERLKGEAPEAADCGEAPLTTLGAAGWPLLVGKIDRPTLETRSIRFDYRPPAGELAVPAPFAEPIQGGQP
ncbi:MAG TPA: hypothetical protein VFZ01_18710 [Geminicoccaceae bacterium]